MACRKKGRLGLDPVKCDNQQKYKFIPEKSMLYTPKGIRYNIPIAVGTRGTQKKPSERRSLSQFMALLKVTQKTAIYIMRSA